MICTLAPGTGQPTFPITEVLPAADFPGFGHLCSLTVVSWSMFPTIQKGDRLELEPADSIRIGDIVVFPFAGALICHRVVGIERNGHVRTQGDAVNSMDQPVPMWEILGRVVRIRRGRRVFGPSSAPRPSLAVRVRKNLDVIGVGCRERVADLVLTVLAFLKRRAPVRRLAQAALTRWVRFYLGVRAPLCSVSAYRFTPLSDASHDDRNSGAVSLVRSLSNDLVIHARLGRHCLGTWHPASGTMQVRRVAAGLGLEESLKAACHTLPPPDRTAWCR